MAALPNVAVFTLHGSSETRVPTNKRGSPELGSKAVIVEADGLVSRFAPSRILSRRLGSRQERATNGVWQLYAGSYP